MEIVHLSSEQSSDATASRSSEQSSDVISKGKGDLCSEAVNYEKYQNIYGTLALQGTFNYLYWKISKGCFVEIKNGKLITFLPFRNPNYSNNNIPGIGMGITAQKELFQDVSSHMNYSDYRDHTKWRLNGCLIRYEKYIKNNGSKYHIFQNMLETLCKKRNIPDISFFLNNRDFPILTNDGSEPNKFWHGDNTPMTEFNYEKYLPIFSMVGSSQFADIPFPTWDDWSTVKSTTFNDPQYFKKHCDEPFDVSDLPFAEKENIAFFRGASTGCGVTVKTNMRLKLATMNGEIISGSAASGQSPTSTLHSDVVLNTGISKLNRRLRKIKGGGLATIDPSVDRGDTSFVDYTTQSTYKYNIIIDGHVSAFRLGTVLSFGSIVLLGDSEYKMWYSDFLIDGYINPTEGHYIPIKKDLSDLKSKIKWCIDHQHECEQIVQNAKQFYNQYISEDGILDFITNTFTVMANNMGPQRYFQRLSVPSLPSVIVQPFVNRTSIVGPIKLTDITKAWGVENYTFAKALDIYLTNPNQNFQMTVVNQFQTSGGAIIKKHSLLGSSTPLIITKTRSGSDYLSRNENIIGRNIVNKLIKNIPNFAWTFEPNNSRLEQSPNLVGNEDFKVMQMNIPGKTLEEYILKEEWNVVKTIIGKICLVLSTGQLLNGLTLNKLHPHDIIISPLRKTKPQTTSSRQYSDAVQPVRQRFAKPSYGKTKPAYGSAKPSYGKTKPSYGKTKPSYGKSSRGTVPRQRTTIESPNKIVSYLVSQNGEISYVNTESGAIPVIIDYSYARASWSTDHADTETAGVYSRFEVKGTLDLLSLFIGIADVIKKGASFRRDSSHTLMRDVNGSIEKFEEIVKYLIPSVNFKKNISSIYEFSTFYTNMLDKHVYVSYELPIPDNIKQILPIYGNIGQIGLTILNRTSPQKIKIRSINRNLPNDLRDFATGLNGPLQLNSSGNPEVVCELIKTGDVNVLNKMYKKILQCGFAFERNFIKLYAKSVIITEFQKFNEVTKTLGFNKTREINEMKSFFIGALKNGVDFPLLDVPNFPSFTVCDIYSNRFDQNVLNTNVIYDRLSTEKSTFMEDVYGLIMMKCTTQHNDYINPTENIQVLTEEKIGHFIYKSLATRKHCFMKDLVTSSILSLEYGQSPSEVSPRIKDSIIETDWVSPRIKDSIIEIPRELRRNKDSPFVPDTWWNKKIDDSTPIFMPLSFGLEYNTQFPDKKGIVIIPFRDDSNHIRLGHLNAYIDYMEPLLKNGDGSPMEILIVEQLGNDKFNRAKLLNIGAVESSEDYFIFSDVDLLPDETLLKHYSNYPENPNHIAFASWNYVYWNDSYMGGILSINREQFARVNGYPNNYWGWGGEDDDLRYRIAVENITVMRPYNMDTRDFDGVITELYHPRPTSIEKLDKDDKKKLRNENKIKWRENGLNNIESTFEIIETKIIGTRTKIISIDLKKNIS
ncbi:MAG: hypothetical protein JKX76_01425 [Colwellia sp.]|nr:hypothetical protein [Colwellia sp.]